MILLLILGCFCVALLLAWGLNWLALVPWRRSAGKHWVERARTLYPARTSARLNLCFITANLALVNYVLFPEVNLLFTTVPAFLGAMLGGYFMSREIIPEMGFKSWLHLVAAGFLLFFIYWGLLFIAILEMPEHFGPLTWLAAGGLLVFLLAFSFGLGIRLLQWLRLLQPAPARLNLLVKETARKMNVPVRSVWMLAGPVSNALALPTTRQLVFSEKLLVTHPDEEIKAICAHELGHLNEPRKVLFARILVSLAFFPLIFVRPLDSLGEAGTNILFLLVAAMLLLWLVGIRVSRRMERRADRIAVDNQADTAIYAQALERLYQTNQMPAVMPRLAKKIHPDLYDRMLAAGVTPGFPKPLPPRGQCWTSWLMLAGVLVFPIVAALAKHFAVLWDTFTINFN